MTLQSYGGGEINTVRQMCATISRGTHSVEGLIQFQSGAPIDLLLGTDLLSRLGFLFLEPGQENHEDAIDLLRRDSWSIRRENPAPDPLPDPQPIANRKKEPESKSKTVPTVQLIQAIRLPV